jgi:putative toxin-antitoxin system antitoxin component (TIGR02293 family)
MGMLQTTSATVIPPGHTGASIGLTSPETTELIHQVENGLPFESLEILARFTQQSIFELGAIISIPERTLARRKAMGKLTPDESDRLVRVAFIFEKAAALFEWEVAPAVQWLLTPKAALSGEVPLRYCRTELGAREVENLIGRLEHGVFS